jgi:hypothetical protein
LVACQSSWLTVIFMKMTLFSLMMQRNLKVRA